MARKKMKRTKTEGWTGVVNSPSPASWVERELLEEEMGYAFGTEENAQPVSVRVEPETIALLDAFATRFRYSRSGMLLSLIRSGLAEAFRALPEKEQRAIAEAANAKATAAGARTPPVSRVVITSLTPVEDEPK